MSKQRQNGSLDTEFMLVLKLEITACLSLIHMSLIMNKAELINVAIGSTALTLKLYEYDYIYSTFSSWFGSLTKILGFLVNLFISRAGLVLHLLTSANRHLHFQSVTLNLLNIDSFLM